MNRPLRFRVWSPKDNTYRYLPQLSPQYISWGDVRVVAGTDDTETGTYWPYEGAVIQQFTGLIDSKGKDIYEGDIVIWDDDRHVVSWLEGSTGWFPFASQQAWAMYFNQTGISLSEVMVIGNIFQNPDLLK